MWDWQCLVKVGIKGLSKGEGNHQEDKNRGCILGREDTIIQFFSDLKEE